MKNSYFQNENEVFTFYDKFIEWVASAFDLKAGNVYKQIINICAADLE